MTDISPINILIANEQAEEAKETALSLRTFFPDSRIEVVYSADEVVHRAAKCEWNTILADADLFRQSGLATLTEEKKQLLLDQWEKIRQAHTTLEDELQQVTGQLSQERGENQAYRELLEKLRQERDQFQERLSQIDEEKQSLLTQLGQTRHTYTLLEEGLRRHDAELSHER